ncbi:MAG: aspartate/glutamate racemase family protein [Bacteroidia bacterium]
MKMIGLVGGIAWPSTVDYYRYLNQGVNEELGALNFSRCLIYSFNYEDIQRNNLTNNWAGTLAMIREASRVLIAGGAEAILLCANTMHHIAEELRADLDVPLIHIAEATADAIVAQGLNKVLLLGTRYTMEFDFFRDKLMAKGIEPMIPEANDRTYVHNVIFNELAYGRVNAASKEMFLEIIERGKSAGAQGVILGCTEIPLLIQQADLDIPAFDTTKIHAEAAVRFSLGD